MIEHRDTDRAEQSAQEKKLKSANQLNKHDIEFPNHFRITMESLSLSIYFFR